MSNAAGAYMYIETKDRLFTRYSKRLGTT